MFVYIKAQFRKLVNTLVAKLTGERYRVIMTLLFVHITIFFNRKQFKLKIMSSVKIYFN